MLKIDSHSFASQKVRGHGIGAESVRCQNIEALQVAACGLSFERKPAVSHHEINRGSRILEKLEIGPGSERQLRHSGIDLVEAEIIARARVGGEGADAHPDYPYAQPISTESVASKITHQQATTPFPPLINTHNFPLSR